MRHLRRRYSLGEQLSGLESQPLAFGPFLGGQTASFGISHTFGIANTPAATRNCTPSQHPLLNLRGITAVGYANKTGKADWLAVAGADVVVMSMEELAASLLGIENNYTQQ
ncbi:hypothetical protein [Streptosporangium sp. NPDC049304]|uniref:hypothetical protein n=1 Tax=Streptosporangium sp. NPDC049304 TaxID=3154830 RepID=UPI003426409F